MLPIYLSVTYKRQTGRARPLCVIWHVDVQLWNWMRRGHCALVTCGQLDAVSDSAAHLRWLIAERCRPLRPHQLHSTTTWPIAPLAPSSAPEMSQMTTARHSLYACATGNPHRLHCVRMQSMVPSKYV